MAATIKNGSTGPDVSAWQKFLNASGFSVVVNGVFDAATELATKSYQAAKGLEDDGVVGPKTWATVPAAPVDTATATNEAGINRLWNVKGIVDKTDNAFRWALLQMSARLMTDPNYIAAVMASESGGTFSPSIKNPMGGATGLIQFMPATAKRLGTTTEALASMSQIEQLAFVEKYFSSMRGKMHSPTDVYMATFLPAFVGKPPSFVLGRKGDTADVSPGLTYAQVYDFNAGFDKDKNGEITVGEVGGTVEAILASARNLPPIDVHPEEAPVLDTFTPGAAVGVSIPVLGLLGGLAYYLWKVLGK